MPPQESDPLHILSTWIDEATVSGCPLASTMALATVGNGGEPHSRTVLVTQISSGGLRFHSSHPTGKTVDIQHDERVAATFHWPSLARQVVVCGTAFQLPDAISDAAYGTRPRQLQLVAWAYDDLLFEAAEDGAVEATRITERFNAAGSRATLHRPGSWTTVEVRPRQLDFWQGGNDAAPPMKTRYVCESGAWRAFSVLP